VASHGVVRGLRWTGAVVLLLVAALLIGASLVARYAKKELLNTDAYVSSVAPLATDPDVQTAIVDRVTTAAMEKLDIPGLLDTAAAEVNIRGAERLIPLAAPAITDWVTNEVHKIASSVVTSPEFATVWSNLNRAAHEQLTGILTGTGTNAVSTDDADIVVDLGPVLAAVKSALVSRGFGLASKIPETSIPYTVGHVERLPEIQSAVHRFTTLATWLPVLALVLLGLAVWLAPNHRRGLLVGLIMTLIVLLVMLAAFRVGRNQVESRALNEAAGAAVYNSVLSLLRVALQTIAVVVILGIVWVFLAGPSRIATAFRRGVNSLLAKVGDAIGPQQALQRFVIRWHTPILLVVAFGLLWWLLAEPSIGTAFLVTAVAALITAAVTLVVHLPQGSDTAGTATLPPA
jgi:hypothetical protein